MFSKLIMAYRGAIHYLHIAQKNSIAKQVANVLSQNSKRTVPTLSKYNPIFVFQRDGHQHTFSSVRGHLFEYELPPQCKNWNSFDNAKILTREVPMIKKINDDMKDLLKNLEKLANGKQQLVLWLDCDRQGEAIAFQVIDVITKINRGIQIKRARFAAVTRTDIISTWQHLIQPNQLQADSVNYRIQMDFRMGCAFTRYQTVTLSRTVKFRQHQVLSYGPCQMPTLGFVVDRYLQIKHFKPEKYWVIKAAIILDEKTRVQLKWERGNVKNQQEANALFYAMFQNAHQGNGMVKGKVLQRNKNDKKKYRPYPLTTVNFQKLATDKLKMSAAAAMSVAQKLYQKGFISYPRTQTNSFPATMNLKNLVQRLAPCPPYQSYIQTLLQQNKYMKPKMGNQNDQAHQPIHPVKSADQSTMTREEWRVYDLIARHFLACCSKDAVGVQSEIVAEIGKEKFKASHLTIKEKNYLEIYTFQRWVQSDFPGEIPPQFQAQTSLSQSQTKPPNYLTQADLITLMQKNQIGTDSTIHQHIQTIQNRKYAIKQGTTFRPTNLGASLIVTYQKLDLKLNNCHIRRMIQQRMEMIQKGQILRNNAALQTLAQVGPLFAKLKQMQDVWVLQMKQAMQQHKDLSQVQTNLNNTINPSNSQDDQPPPNNNTSSFTNIRCFTCGEPGHTSPNCPNKNQPRPPQTKNIPVRNKSNNKDNNATTTMNGIVCYLCKEPGHLSTNCPNKNSNQNNRQQPTYNRNNNNNTNNREFKAKKFTCFKCGEEGHLAPQCTNMRKGNTTTSTNQRGGGQYQPKQEQQQVCYSCGEPGHFSTNCPNKNNTGYTSFFEQKEKVQKPKKDKKVCPECGHQGRHPRGTPCPTVRKNKNKSQTSQDQNQYY